MKTLKLMLIVPIMALFIQTIAAKDKTNGLYLTRQDYLDHKLSYGDNNYKIKVNGFFENNYVVVIHEGQKQVLLKNNIFGYSKYGKDYRFFDNTEYRIMQNKGLTIYSRINLVLQGKGPRPTEQYYFSSNLSAPVQPLSIANLQSVFEKNKKFVYAVESSFKKDYNLLAFDTCNKEYKLIDLYMQNAM